MLNLLNTKLLLAVVALLTAIASYMAYQNHQLAVLERTQAARLAILERAEADHARVEAARKKEQEDFIKKVKKYKDDNTWTDGEKAFKSFRLP